MPSPSSLHAIPLTSPGFSWRTFCRPSIRLIDFPQSGRIVPEIGDRSIREIILGNYRIIYRLRSEAVEILTVHHGAASARSKETEVEATRDTHPMTFGYPQHHARATPAADVRGTFAALGQWHGPRSTGILPVIRSSQAFGPTERLFLLAEIQRGIQQADAGELILYEKAKERTAKCLSPQTPWLPPPVKA